MVTELQNIMTTSTGTPPHIFKVNLKVWPIKHGEMLSSSVDDCKRKEFWNYLKASSRDLATLFNHLYSAQVLQVFPERENISVEFTSSSDLNFFIQKYKDGTLASAFTESMSLSDAAYAAWNFTLSVSDEEFFEAKLQSSPGGTPMQSGEVCQGVNEHSVMTQTLVDECNNSVVNITSPAKHEMMSSTGAVSSTPGGVSPGSAALLGNNQQMVYVTSPTVTRPNSSSEWTEYTKCKLDYVNDISQTEFQLYTHDMKVSKAWVCLKCDGTVHEMQKVNGAWFSQFVSVTVGSWYHYRIELKGGIIRWLKRTFVGGVDQFDEDVDRTVCSYFIHRDILQGKQCTPQEWKIMACSGCKLFLPDLLDGIGSDEDLYWIAHEFEMKHLANMQLCIKHELVRIIMEHYSKLGNSANVAQAAFVVYFLSLVVHLNESWVGPTQVKPEDAKQLLMVLQNYNIEEHLCDLMNVFIPLTFRRLLKLFVPNASWLHYVYHCYPTLSCKALVEMSCYFWSECNDKQVCCDLINRLCVAAHGDPEMETLLKEVMKHVKQPSWLLKVYISEEWSDGLKHELNCHIGEVIKADVIPKWKEPQAFVTMDKLSDEISSADPFILEKLAPDFERVILAIIGKPFGKGRAEVQLANLIARLPMFRDSDQAAKLLKALAASKVAEWHGLIPALLNNSKFSTVMSNELTTDVCQLWLTTYVMISDSVLDVTKHHGCLYQMLTIPHITENNDVKAAMEKQVDDCFCKVSQGVIAKYSEQHHLSLIEAAVKHLANSRDVLDRLRHDLQSAVHRILREKTEWKDDDITRLTELAASGNYLFIDANSVVKLLGALASVSVLPVRKVFLAVLKQHSSSISVKDLDVLLQDWMSNVKKCCSRQAMKEAKSNYSHVYLPCLYNSLIEAHELSLEKHPDISEKVTAVLKEECGRHQRDLEEILSGDLKIVAEEALVLMTKHIDEILTENLPPLVTLLQLTDEKLDRIEEKYAITALLRHLRQIHMHFIGFSSSLDKELFFLKYHHIWSKVLDWTCSGRRESELKNSNVVHLMRETVFSLVEHLQKKKVTVNEFQSLRNVVSETNKVKLFEFLGRFSMGPVDNAWESMTNEVSWARASYQHLKALYENFLVLLHMEVKIVDLQIIKCQLDTVEGCLSGSIRCLVADIGNAEFFGCLTGLLTVSEKIEPLSGLATFLTVSKRILRNSVVDPTAVAVSNLLAVECLNEYRKWLAGVTQSSTLDYVLLYNDSIKTACTEVQIATKLLDVRITDNAVSSLGWFKDLRCHSDHIRHIKHFFEVFSVALDGTSLGDAIFTFFTCLDSPDDVTLDDLNAAMESLRECLIETDETWWAVLEELSKATELVSFLYQSSGDDLRILIDAVEERTEQTIDESTVSDLIQVKLFLQPILMQMTPNTPDVLLHHLKQLHESRIDQKEMASRINNCCHHVHGLKALYQHVADRGELTKEIVANAMAFGHYKWTLDRNMSCCTAQLTYTMKRKDKQDKFCFSLDELIDLRSRVLLVSTSDKLLGDEDADEIIAQKLAKLKTDMDNFVCVIDKINEIALTVTHLHRLGHFLYRSYSRKITSSSEMLSELKLRLGCLDEELEEWKKILDINRKVYLSLNFLFSDQLSNVAGFLYQDADDASRENLDSLLYFIHPGIKTKDLSLECSQPHSSVLVTLSFKLQKVGQVLDSIKGKIPCSRKCFPDAKEFMQQSHDVNAVVEPGRLLVAHLETDSTQTIPVLLSLYANTMHYFPFPSEVLFCHEETSWEEVYLLIQRCIMTSAAESGTLYCIVSVEKLPNSLQYQLVQELGRLVDADSNVNYRLAVICHGGMQHSIVGHFGNFVRRVQGFDAPATALCLKTTWPDVTMITSGVPGLGKTEYIRQHAAELNCRVSSVHISGPITRRSLVMRLKTSSLRNNCALHFDIAEVDDPTFLDAILFEFIFLGCISSGTEIVCLPTGRVFFEVGNTVNNRLRDSLVVLGCFNRVHLKWKSYEDYQISHELMSPIQIVCHYLRTLDRGILDSIDVKLMHPVPDVECRALLFRHFSTPADLSFAMVDIFLNVFAGQLKQLCCSQFFTVRNLKAMLGEKKTIDVRSKLVIALLEVAKEFACRSVQSCRSAQKSALSQPVAGNLGTLMANRVEGMLQWADSNHLIVAFHGNSQSMSVLYRDLALVPLHVKELFKTQTRKDMADFNKLAQSELQSILEKLCRASIQATTKKPMHQMYALTADNLLKMVLILLRIRAKVPVVIMGETGCGKTSLVRYLASSCGSLFEHYNIHAGITESDILNEMSKIENLCKTNPKEQVWLFLDEINTCDHIGLLTEIICHHSLFSRCLAGNLILIAACNPYRLRESNQIFTAGLRVDKKVKVDEYSQLVYRVRPLPERMIDYVWDYGVLNLKDEAAYIKQMVRGVFTGKFVSFEKHTVEVLVASQDFVRRAECSGWCVSLRDVNRCRMLIVFFLDMLHMKAKLSKSPVDDVHSLHIRAITLALAHCYVSRIASTKSRQDYWKCCANILLGSGDSYGNLADMVKEEQLELLNRMNDIPQGIAKNTALCENVFVILVCILNRIPIFLVGKPGCSKSLSVQLIKSHLRGRDSHDEYFKTLPNLYIVSYQGSESSTSEGIVKVFAKADKYQKANTSNNVLPVVLLDEVGLAESSKFNPLKVLHSLLEPNTGELPSVAVVGISNWALDAAKMNRAIYLSRPDMDEDELYETGVSISAVRSQNEPLKLTRSSSSAKLYYTVSKGTLRALAKAYFEYEKTQKVRNFHGLRDFYSLIKFVSHELLKTGDTRQEEEIRVIQKGLLRNFGGLTYELNNIIRHFLKATNVKERLSWKVEEIIADNLQDQGARHLMLITNGDSALGVLMKLLSDLQRKAVVIFGSRFEEDQTEDYSYRILSRIILCMESGSTLVLKDLDNIYGSLYDMLNQNYSVVGKKKNCRIALGPYSNPMCQVHDEFRCVVLVNEGKVDHTDPPFLNRFEKQVVRFEDIIDDSQLAVIKELSKWMEDFSTITDLPFTTSHCFMGINDDTVPSLVYQVSRLNDSNVMENCKNALMWLILPDAVLRASHSKLAERDRSEVEHFQRRYFELPVHDQLSEILLKVISCSSMPPAFNKTRGFRLVIYTHTNIHVDLHAVLQPFKSVQIEKLGAFRSEKELMRQLRMFFESKSQLLILQCRPSEDGDHIPLAKFLLEELHQEYEAADGCDKNICLVLHMERCATIVMAAPWSFSYLSGWQLMTVDSLDDPGDHPIPTILNSAACDLLQSKFMHIHQCIGDRLIWSFTCTSSAYLERPIEEFKTLAMQIFKSTRLISFLSDHILDIVRSTESVDDGLLMPSVSANWIVTVARDMRRLQSATSFVDALQQYLAQLVAVPLANIIYRLEKLSALHSYFLHDDTQQELWERLFDTKDVFDIGIVEPVQGPGSFVIDRKPLNMRFPFSEHFISKLCRHAELFKQQLTDLEGVDENIDQQGELKDDVYKEQLVDQFCVMFSEDLQLLSTICDFQQHVSDFDSDICNYLAVEHMPEEEMRVNIAKWFIRFKCHSLPDLDPMTSVTESLLCLWRYEDLFHAVLHLIAECRTFLPYDVDVLLKKIDSVCLPTVVNEEDVKSVESDVAEKAVSEQASSGIVVDNSASDDLISTCYDVETALDEATEEGFRAEDAARTDECAELEPTTNTHNAEDLSVSDLELLFGRSLNFDDSGEITENEIIAKYVTESPTDQPPLDMVEIPVPQPLVLHPEEQLIHVMCNALVPSVVVFQECGSIDAWQMRVCSVLSFSSLVSGFPKMLHILRVFNDLAMILLHCHLDEKKIEHALCRLSESIDKNDNMEMASDISDMLPTVLEVLDYLQIESVSQLEVQHFFCIYTGRCLDVDPGTDVLQQFLHYVATNSPSGELSCYLEPVVVRVVLENEESLFDELIGYIIDEEQFDSELHPALMQLDMALKSVDKNNLLLLSLCVDVIQNAVFVKHSWDELALIDCADHRLIVACKAAADILEHGQTLITLRVAIAASYLRTFFAHLSCILVHDADQNNCNFSNHNLLYMSINPVLDHSSVDVLFEYIIKCLQTSEKSLFHVRKLFKQAQTALPALGRYSWSEDDVVMSLGYSLISNNACSSEGCEKLKVVLPCIAKDDAPVVEYLNSAFKTSEGMLSLIQTIAHLVYLPSSFRQLSITDKQFGEWLSGRTELEPKPVHKLLSRLAGKESFNVDLLQLTPESGYVQVQQAAVVQHLMSVVIAHQSEPAFELLWKCVSNPADDVVKEVCRILSASSVDGTMSFGIGFTSDLLVECRCWARLCISTPIERCPLCDVEWHPSSMPDSGNGDEMLAESCNQELLLTAEILLKVLVHGALLGSYSLGQTDGDGDGLHVEMRKSSKSQFFDSWKLLENCLQFSTGNTALALHYAIDRWSSQGSFAVTDAPEVSDVLDVTKHKIVEFILTPKLETAISEYLSMTTTATDDMKQAVYELQEEQLDYRRHLFRMTKDKTLEDMKAKFHLCIPSLKHPVIELFFEMEPALQLIRHLVPILKWALLSNKTVSHQLSREDCTTVKVNKHINTMSAKDKTCFEQFCKAWEAISSHGRAVLSAIDPTLSSLPPMHGNAVLQTCIIDSSNSVVWRALDALRTIQNTFLDRLLVIASKTKCPAVSFMRKSRTANSDVTAVSCVLIQKVKEHQLIQCNYTDLTDLMVFAQNDPRYGHGTQIHYDFIKIENEIANRLALGKVYIKLDQSFPLVTYANELFVACASVLREFATLVPQEPLRPVMKSAIESRHRGSADYVQLMMRQTEVLLCIAKRTVGPADQTLSSFVHSWLRSLPGGFAADLFPSSIEPLRLSHLVALYEFLEDLQADGVIDSLPNHFRNPMTDGIREELKQFADTNHVPIESFRTALRRFVMRNIAHFDVEKIDLKQALSTWLVEPSLWPDGVKEDGTLTHTEDPQLKSKNLKDEFPKMATLEHIHSTVKYIDFLIQDRVMKLRSVPLPSKAAAPLSAAKPSVARGTRLVSKTKVGRTMRT